MQLTTSQRELLTNLPVEALDTLCGWVLKPHTIPAEYAFMADSGITFEMVRAEQNARIAAEHAAERAQLDAEWDADTNEDSEIITVVLTDAQYSMLHNCIGGDAVDIDGDAHKFTWLSTRVKGTRDMFEAAAECVHQYGEDHVWGIVSDACCENEAQRAFAERQAFKTFVSLTAKLNKAIA